MKAFTFNSQWELGAELPLATQAEIKNEPMLFRCDGEHAMEMGGVLTRRFMSALPNDWKTSQLSIDSRSHMLMPEWYPCVPGWHHDDVPRDRSDGQPNYVDPSYKAEHVMALFGDASLTQFAIGKAKFPDVPLGSVFYREWHPIVEEKIQFAFLSRSTAPQSRLIFFDWQTWHQGMPATMRGWRFFIRATRNNPKPPMNETRQNAQVYMPAIMGGW